ncbi:hypothetical protein FHG87_003827 [Trinorchestia longiramus]|nr:hypothetical protein FHG87_003827 [Trinorchestia longiramus]
MKCQRFKSRQQRALEQVDHRRDHFLHTTRGLSLRRSLERWTFSHFTDPYRERWSSDVKDSSFTRNVQAKNAPKNFPANRPFGDTAGMRRFELPTNAWESSNIFDLLSISDEDIDEELRMRIERLLQAPTDNLFETRVSDQDVLESKQESSSIEESSTLGLINKSTSSIDVEKGCKNPYLNFLKRKSHGGAIEKATVETHLQENVGEKYDTFGNSKEDNVANIEENDETEVINRDHIEAEVKQTGVVASPQNVKSSKSGDELHPGSDTEDIGTPQVDKEKEIDALDMDGEKGLTDLESSIKSTAKIIKATAIQKKIALKKRRKRARKKNIKDSKSENTLESQTTVLEALEESTVLKLFRDYLSFEKCETLVPFKSDIIFKPPVLPE